MSKRSRNDAIDEHMDSKEIRTIVLEIACAAGSPKEKEAFFRKRHPEFAESYPALFEMACRPGFDMNRFIYMMEMREKVMQRERTVEDASMEVGQALFNEYVKPVLPFANKKDGSS